jgi:WhiB family redox-sensing transcriptional regulator
MERMIQDPEWYKDANCASTDPEVMFPTDRAGVTMAKAICARCLVVQDCLTDALRIKSVRETTGVLGGLSARERIRMNEEAGEATE